MNTRRIATAALSGLFFSPTLTAQVKEFKFDVKTLGGRRVTEQDFKEGPLLVDLWGTWCPPCRDAIPHLVDIYRRYKHHGLEVVGLNYEQGDPSGHDGTVRDFAAKNGITYTLAHGTPEIQKQIEGFSGFPTLLFFKKGLVFDHMEVGFAKDSGAEKKIEEWVRGALGLDGEEGGADSRPDASAGGEREGEPAKKKPAAKVTDKLAPGVIYKPEDGDRGFDFELKDLDGKDLKFADFRGKVVAVPILLAGDTASKEVAGSLAELQAKYGEKGFAVAGVCFGKSSDPGEQATQARSLADSAKARFPLGIAKLDFIKKIHQATGIPIVLLFDREGVLKLRETGSSAQKREELEKKVREVLGIDV